MPEFWFWGLLASIILLAIGASLKAVEFRFELQMANKVISRLWEEVDTLKKGNNESISNKSQFPQGTSPKNSKPTSQDEYPFHVILTSIAKYHSQEIPATPQRIAGDIGLDPEITLAYMWKYHNEQFITFRSGGAKPGIETPFLLSPKAMEHIEISTKNKNS